MNRIIKLILLISLYFIQINLAYRYSYSNIDWGILFLNLFLEFLLFNKLNNLRSYFCSYFLFFSIFFSMHMIAFFKMYEEHNYNEYANLSIFGNELLCVVLVSLMISHSLVRYPKIKFQLIKSERLIPSSTFYVLAIFSFLISMLCMVFGISRMGSDSGVVLPFKLNGILYMYRTVIVPYLFFVYVYNRISNGKNMKPHEYLIMFLYGLLEVFVRLSKSALINVFFPILVFAVISRFTKQIKGLYRYAIPVVVVFILLYPIITYMRYSEQVNQESFINAYQRSQIEDEDEGLDIYKRFFHGGKHYMDCYFLFANQPFFDFSRLPMIMAEKGCAGYYTHVVEGYSKYAVHSSGTTGITDPYLIGGKGLCFIVFIALTVVGMIIDRRITQSAILYKVLAIQIFYQFVLFKNLTAFIDHLFLSFIATLIIQLLIIKFYSNKYITVVKDQVVL